jgi:hypothetical protein
MKNQGRLDGKGMSHEWGRRGIFVAYWWKRQKVTDK